MKKIDAVKWVNALRSGEYQQTKGCLQDSEGFCCLGVACDIFIKPGSKITKSNGVLSGDMPENQTYAPAWLLNIDDDFQLKTGEALPELNDTGFDLHIEDGEDFFTETVRLSFDEIADLIQAVYILKVVD